MKRSEEEKLSPKFVIIDTQSKQLPNDVQLGISESRSLEKAGDKKEDTPSVKGKTEDVYYNKADLRRRKIIHPGMKNTEVLNAFRNLRLSLRSKMEAQNSVILVSSVNRLGSAGYTAINLATAFTLEHDKKALLVDCNFNKTPLAKTLGVQADSGLYDYLVRKESRIEALVKDTTVPRLSLVPRGGPGAEEEDATVEIFSGSLMSTFISKIKEQYQNRVVILDAPPILESADTKILAGMSDLIVVALPYKGATSAQVSKTIEEFGSDQISGFVMID